MYLLYNDKGKDIYVDGILIPVTQFYLIGQWRFDEEPLGE